MMPFKPRSRELVAYARNRSGVRWADTIRNSWGTPRWARTSAACVKVGQSDWLPMMIPISGGAFGCAGISGYAVWNQPTFQAGDLVTQHQLALFQPLQVQLIRRPLVGQPRDNGVEVAMLAA